MSPGRCGTWSRCLRTDRPAAEVMRVYAMEDAARGRNEACSCGSGRKFKRLPRRRAAAHARGDRGRHPRRELSAIGCAGPSPSGLWPQPAARLGTNHVPKRRWTCQTRPTARRRPMAPSPRRALRPARWPRAVAAARAAPPSTRAILEATLERLAIDGYQRRRSRPWPRRPAWGAARSTGATPARHQLVTAGLRHSTSLEEAALPSGTPEALRSLLASTSAASQHRGADGAGLPAGRGASVTRRSWTRSVTPCSSPGTASSRASLPVDVAAGEVRSDVDARIVIDVRLRRTASRGRSSVPRSRTTGGQRRARRVAGHQRRRGEALSARQSASILHVVPVRGAPAAGRR